MPGEKLLTLAHWYAENKPTVENLRAYFVVANGFLQDGHNPAISMERRKYLHDYFMRILEYIDGLPCNVCKCQAVYHYHGTRKYVSCARCQELPSEFIEKIGCKHSDIDVDLKFDELIAGHVWIDVGLSGEVVT